MINIKNHDSIGTIKNDILSVLVYFDIFNYPLTRIEIISFLSNKYSEAKFNNALQDLCNSSHIYKLGEYYCLKNSLDLEKRRKTGNKKAKKMMATAKKVCYLLSAFPYVRGVGISGSLSKNFADERSDIDLFIITAKNRLWIARSFLHIILKLSTLIKKQHFFCMNYYIDEAALEIQEKNIYTAIEIATLIPLRGISTFDKFFFANNWVKKMFPNNYMNISTTKSNKTNPVKWFIEMILNNSLGNLIDTALMKITAKRWNKRTADKVLTKSGLLFSIQSDKHYAKHDPSTFQDGIVSLHKTRLSEILTSKNMKYKAVN